MIKCKRINQIFFLTIVLLFIVSQIRADVFGPADPEGVLLQDEPEIMEICPINPLDQIFPNQNMCKLLLEIPAQLRNLSYVVYPSAVGNYNTARFNYNKRFNVFPNAVIAPTTTEEVAYIIKTLRDLNLPFSIRSAGHCAEPGSLVDIGYILDLKNFNQIELDVKNSEVFIGVGAHLGTVIQTLGKKGYLIPTGECPSVGTGGLTLGGGLGLLCRQLGLTCDSIKSILFVTAKSKIIEVTKKDDPDLFWALCGAGNGSYGVVLGFKFQMYKIPKLNFLRLVWENWDPKVSVQVVEQWQKWVSQLSDEITTELGIRYQNGSPQIAIIASKLDCPEGFDEWKKFFKHLNPTIIVNECLPYVEVAKRVAGVYTQPFSKSKSKFLFSPLSKQGVLTLVNLFDGLIKSQPDILIYFELGSGGGAIKKHKSAFFARDEFAHFFQFVYWNFQSQEGLALKLAEKFYNALAPFTSPFSYVNLADYDLGKDYLFAYYGDHVNKLVDVKKEWDPTNLFKWRQSIPVSL